MTRTPPQALARAMDRATVLAARGPRGANPQVGCVILSPAGTVLAEGFHRGAGTPHAEASALNSARKAGIDLAGSTAIVTLEPCAHEGRTPSCAKALIEARVARVLFASADPHVRAAGGAQLLTESGIEAMLWSGALTKGEALAKEARSLNARWFVAKKGGRPFVTAKIAQSLDGFVAAADGTSQWITGPEARALGHELRGRVDAIAVGSGTLRADNPSLTARRSDGTLHPQQPLRVVIGKEPVPEDAALRGSDGRFVHLSTRDLEAALGGLAADYGVEHLLIEGGPTLIAAALKADLVDDLWIHVAPTLLGSGRSSAAGLNVATLAERHDFTIDESSLTVAGSDLLIHLAPAQRATRKD